MWHLIWQRPCNLQLFCHMVDVNNQLRLLVWNVFSHLAWHLSWQIFSHPVWHSDISGSLHQCTEANKVKNESTKEQNRNNWRRASGGGRSGPKEHRDNFVLVVFPFCRLLWLFWLLLLFFLFLLFLLFLFFLVALVVCTAGSELNVVLAALVIKQTNKEASGKAETATKAENTQQRNKKHKQKKEKQKKREATKTQKQK